MTKTLTGGLLLCWLTAGQVQAESQVLDLTRLDHWESHSFDGETAYAPAVDVLYGKVLKATSQDSASGYYYRNTVHLDNTPMLRWAWKVDRFPESRVADASEGKRHDDYAARVYVARMSMLGMWGAKCITYVWSDRHAAGEEWKSPFTDRIHMIAVNGREHGPGQWRQVQRNLVEDWGRVFGERIDSVDLVAIMTDSDNTDSNAQAWYANLRLEPGGDGRLAVLKE